MTATWHEDAASAYLLDLVDRWHHGAGRHKQLHEFIGVSREQYAAWVGGRIGDLELVRMIVA